MTAIGRRFAPMRSVGRSVGRGIAVLALAGLAACAPDSPYEAPKFPFAAGYGGARGGSPVLLDNAEWWHRFNDPVLNRLVAVALRDNLTLAAARERVIEAQAARDQVPGAALLTATLGTPVQNTGGEPFVGTGQGQLGLSWMLDPWGMRRDQIRAAGARAEAAAAEADAAQLLVLFNLTNAYVDLRYRERLVALARADLATRQDTLAMTETMLAASAATRLEITRSEARVAELQSQLPALEAAVAAKRNEIAVLTGAAPGRPAVDPGTGPQPRPRLSPDVGIPADLLRNRPDIRIAERQYYAALADVGVAEAALYPQLSLTGAITLNALEGGANSTDYYFGPTLQFPVLPATGARATVAARESRARQALTGWKATVLDAILEVENALLDYRAVSTSMKSATRAADLYAEALTLTRQVFQLQNATLGDLIDAEQAVSAADNAVAETLWRQGLSFVSLNVRLGSGSAAGRGG
jgi:multidrug efflux system outer membrane protein